MEADLAAHAAEEKAIQEAEAAAAAAKEAEELQNILGELTDTAQLGFVYVHAPEHFVAEDSPEVEAMRVAHLRSWPTCSTSSTKSAQRWWT